MTKTKKSAIFGVLALILIVLAACLIFTGCGGEQKITLYVKDEVYKEIKIEEGYTIPDAEVEGYTFEAWYTTKSFEEMSRVDTKTSTFTKSTKLYAKLQPITYTIGAYYDRGEQYTGQAAGSYNVDSKSTLPVLASDGDYAFLGWCEDAALTTAPRMTTEGFVGNIDALYAKYAYPSTLTSGWKDLVVNEAKKSIDKEKFASVSFVSAVPEGFKISEAKMIPSADATAKEYPIYVWAKIADQIEQTYDVTVWAPNTIYAPEDSTGLFVTLTKCKSFNFENFSTKNVTSMKSMFSECLSLENVDLSKFDTSNVTTMKNMFTNSGISSFNFGVLDTSNVQDISYMFSHCDNLKSVSFVGADTSSVKRMEYMFGDCDNIESIDMTGCNFENLKNAYALVCNCYSLSEIKTPAKLGDEWLNILIDNSEKVYFFSTDDLSTPIQSVVNKDLNKTLYKGVKITFKDYGTVDSDVDLTNRWAVCGQVINNLPDETTKEGYSRKKWQAKYIAVGAAETEAGTKEFTEEKFDYTTTVSKIYGTTYTISGVWEAEVCGLEVVTTNKARSSASFTCEYDKNIYAIGSSSFQLTPKYGDIIKIKFTTNTEYKTFKFNWGWVKSDGSEITDESVTNAEESRSGYAKSFSLNPGMTVELTIKVKGNSQLKITVE